ncbi:arylsulfatase [Bradyrhizobium sediminis]|uniref:Arylsulfatase n=1 Tax=Bradyrhizobium sediminis TaxID=2840469 RepID=A0A975NRL9_9BRAD|nr:arylsulfatase [Bradyrhizobium sediminis]QWG19436.1 arylsulfatase [Bradyrhizobium sediminis]
MNFPAILATLFLTSALSAPALAQQAQTSGPPLGSPAATITIPGDQLPPLPPKFGGVINETTKDSKPWWPPTVVPPKGAPNVLLIMTDDSGYGVPSTFGGVIPTPALDRIANAGLRYTQFHSTALCSPTRAALITGRNHHSVGFGNISELATGYPGYDSVIGPENATIGRILSDNGYATSWFGKNHNTPSYLYSAAGPFDQWPSGMGFQYFYGFMGGESDQWKPYLFRDHTPVFPWVGKPDYNLVTDMADDAIGYMKQLNASAPDKPFFVYYVPGATHSPHHPTKEWIDKFKGKFDMGWEKLREQTFANQKRLGVIPANTELTPWPDSLPKWDSLSVVQKKIVTREAEVFAAYTAYNDHEIGRVIQAVEDMGKLDNTLIIYINGDNGTSSEGSMQGTPNTMTVYNGVLELPEVELLRYYESWGSDQTYPHMAVPWAWAFNTPFKWVKQVASHFGGTRQGMAISWPGHITDVGGIRSQFHHVIDIVPTILEAAGLRAPASVDGVPQKPIEGVSMTYTFDKANANASSKHETQYFEIMANRGIYHDGWYAGTTPALVPWKPAAGGPLPDVTSYKWELYNISEDFSQNRDLAATNPGKLKEMQALFLSEAQKYQVLPLDNTVLTRLLTPRPSGTAGRTEFTYVGENAGIPIANAPSLLNRDYTITADITVPNGGAEGMIATMGGRFGGYALYLLKGKPVFVYNLLNLKRYRWEGGVGAEDWLGQSLSPGKHKIVFDFKYDGPGLGKGGSGVLSVDGKVLSQQKMDHSIPFMMALDESLDIGLDTRTALDDSYKLPFRFTGTIDKLSYKIRPEQLAEDDRKVMQKAVTKAND